MALSLLQARGRRMIADSTNTVTFPVGGTATNITTFILCGGKAPTCAGKDCDDPLQEGLVWEFCGRYYCSCECVPDAGPPKRRPGRKLSCKPQG